MVDTKLIGRVNWFDSKKGFGFITVMTKDDENTGNDVFVHYTSINVESNYKKVFPGEYVEFAIGSGKDGRPICTEVSGLHGGSLLSENENHRYKYFPRNSHGDSGPGEDQVEGPDDDAVGDQ